MMANAPPAQKIYLATVLRKAKNGWTPARREKYFKLFYAFLGRKGGNSYVGYVNEARKMALANVPKEQFAQYDSISGSALLNGAGIKLAGKGVGAKGPGRNWTMAEALPLVQNKLIDRNFEQGKAMLTVSLCGSCHSMRGEGVVLALT